MNSTPLKFTQCWVYPVQVGLHLFSASLVHDLPTHRTAAIGELAAGRKQFAADAVDTLAEHYFNARGLFVEDHDIEKIPGVGDTNFDFFYLHDVCLLPLVELVCRRVDIILETTVGRGCGVCGYGVQGKASRLIAKPCAGGADLAVM